jgi:hypothetical protein
MKTLLIITTFLILTACNSKSGDKTNSKIHTDSSTIVSSIKPIDSTNIHFDTLIINNLRFIQTLLDNKFNCLISSTGDTIVKAENYYFEAQFLDINEDGYKDIRVSFFSSNPSQSDNYLFDKELNTFKQIENCELHIQKIKDTKFYYSYSRTGCSDMNWESYLSKIENYKLVNYGYIHGQGCDFEVKDNPQVIEIYKITDSGEKLESKLPYLKYIHTFDDKWDFIEKYWRQNYKTFDR